MLLKCLSSLLHNELIAGSIIKAAAVASCSQGANIDADLASLAAGCQIVNMSLKTGLPCLQTLILEQHVADWQQEDCCVSLPIGHIQIEHLLMEIYWAWSPDHNST
jgi:hypothetical protein